MLAHRGYYKFSKEIRLSRLWHKIYLLSETPTTNRLLLVFLMRQHTVARVSLSLCQRLQRHRGSISGYLVGNSTACNIKSPFKKSVIADAQENISGEANLPALCQILTTGDKLNSRTNASFLDVTESKNKLPEESGE